MSFSTVNFSKRQYSDTILGYDVVRKFMVPHSSRDVVDYTVLKKTHMVFCIRADSGTEWLCIVYPLKKHPL